MGGQYRCKRMVKHISGKCWQHRSLTEKNIPYTINKITDNNVYPESVVSDLLHYVRTNDIRVIVFDYDLTASKVHLRGWGSFEVKPDEEKHIIQQQYVHEQSKNLTTPFILAMTMLNEEGYDLAIATMSDASHNSDTILVDGSTKVIYTGEPFIKDVLKNIFPSFHQKIYVVGMLEHNKISHMNKIRRYQPSGSHYESHHWHQAAETENTVRAEWREWTKQRISKM